MAAGDYRLTFIKACEVIVSSTSVQLHQRGGFIPAEFFDDIDVAQCALDDQLEQLHRQYAAASRG